MDPGYSARLPNLVADALELAPEAREDFLVRACGDDAELLAEARSLLGHDQDQGEFLERPAHDPEGRGWLSGQDELAPGELVGECRVESLLGEGGMGEVYLAWDTRLERHIALKLLKRQFDDGTLLRRFRHERRVLAGLTHPNIARLYGGALTPEGRAFLVMEYVEGERLDHFCQARSLGIDARLTLFRKVCAAVAYAHQNLVVHRDLKPANIRVTPEGEPKLLDFGIAKLLEAEGTGTGPAAEVTVTMQGAMTPEYASPEQIKGEAITTASDVYSLGVVLYELLCGQRPYQFKSRRPDELARAICETDPPRPSTVASRTTTSIGGVGMAPPPEAPRTLRRQLAGDLDNIVAKAMRKEPARRYGSVGQLAEDIRRYSAGLPVAARPDTLPYRAGKFVRRNKVGVGAAILVVLALVTGLLAAVWQARLAGRERDRARVALTEAKTAQKQAERINEFLQGILASASPKKLGKDVRVVQVLDNSAGNLDRDLAGEPDVLAQAHLTLGQTYRSLGLFEPAEQQTRAALVLVRRLRGADGPATAAVEFALGDILANRRQITEAEALLQHALAVLRRQSPPDHAALANTLATLGYTLYSEPQRNAEAGALVNEALSQARLAWGERDPKYLLVLGKLAAIEVGRRDWAAGAAAYRQLLTLQDLIVPGSVDSLATQANLCICLFNEEKLDPMVIALNRLEADTRRLVGENSVYFAAATTLRGLLGFARGEYEASIPFLQRALSLSSATYAPDNVSIIQCQTTLGLCLTRVGRAADGEPLLRAAYEHGSKVNRAELAHTIGDVEIALGECLLARGQFAEAEKMLLAGHEDLKTRLGDQNRFTAHAASLLHDLYLAWDKPAQATRFASGGPAPAATVP